MLNKNKRKTVMCFMLNQQLNKRIMLNETLKFCFVAADYDGFIISSHN